MIAALLWAGCACDPAPSPASPDAVSTGDTGAAPTPTYPTPTDSGTDSLAVPTGDTGRPPWVLDVLEDYLIRIRHDMPDGSDIGVGANGILGIDVDLDGRDELLMSSKGSGIYVFKLDGAERELGTSDAFMVVEGAAWMMCAGDFNGDGVDDVLHHLSQVGTDRLFASLNPIPEGGAVEVIVPTGFRGSTASCGDLNGDGFDDVLYGSGTVNVWFGPFEAGTSVPQHSLFGYDGPAGKAQYPLAIPDITGDGVPDLSLMSFQQPMLAEGPFAPGVFADIPSYSLYEEKGSTSGRAVIVDEARGVTTAMLFDDYDTDHVLMVTYVDGAPQVDRLVDLRGEYTKVQSNVADYNRDGERDFVLLYEQTAEIFLGPFNEDTPDEGHAVLRMDVVRFVFVTDGDFDGDGDDELVLADSSEGIYIFDFDPENFRPQ